MSLKIKATELRTELLVERKRSPPRDQDDFSEQQPSWSPVRIMACKVETASGFEKFTGTTVKAQLRKIITTRYQQNLLTTDRFRNTRTDTVYNIETIDNYEDRSRWLVITAIQSDGSN